MAANDPALVLAPSTAGLFAPDTAFILAQLLALGVLAYFGGRIGWRGRGRFDSALVGGGVTGGLGLSISLLKYAIH